MNQQAISGTKAHRNGYSIHYNPYRNRGTAEQYCQWEREWLEAECNDKPSIYKQIVNQRRKP